MFLWRNKKISIIFAEKTTVSGDMLEAVYATKYIRTSLSQTRLFQITPYLEWKSGPCFNMKLWQQVTK